MDFCQNVTPLSIVLQKNRYNCSMNHHARTPEDINGTQQNTNTHSIKLKISTNKRHDHPIT